MIAAKCVVTVTLNPEDKTMSLTIGSREEEGRKELLLTISGEDIENFHEGREIVKSSGDSIGDFTVTVVLARPYAVHKDCRRLLNTKNPEYRGFKLIAQPIGYRTEFGHEADTLNEVLHELDRHESLEEAKEALCDKGEYCYNNHYVIRPTHDQKYTVTGNDVYDCALDALHAIDRGEV